MAALIIGEQSGFCTPVRIFGANDTPAEAEKFGEPTWYAFGEHGQWSRWVKFVRRDGQYFALSDGPSLPVDTYLSAQRFDQLCWGVCRPV